MSGEKHTVDVVELPVQRTSFRGKIKSIFKFFKKVIGKLKIVLALGLIVLAGYVANSKYHNSRPVIIVGLTKISRGTYNQLAMLAKDSPIPSRSTYKNKISVKDVIVEAEKYKLTAERLKIEVSDQDIEQVARIKYALTDAKPNKWQLLSSYKEAFQSQAIIQGYTKYQVSIMHFGFGRYVDTTEVPTDKKFRDPSAIEEDRKYAIVKAQEYREKALASNFDFITAKNKILEDQRLLFGSFGNRTRKINVTESGFVAGPGGGTSGEQLYSFEMNIIRSLQEGQVSDIKTTNVFLTYNPGNGPRQRADIGYYFIKLDKKMDPNPDLQSAIDKNLKEIEVKTNV